MNKRIIAILAVSLFLMNTPVQADVKNLDVKVREVEVIGVGADANAAQADAEIKALEMMVFTMVQTDQEKAAYQKIRDSLLNKRGEYLNRKKVLGKGSSDAGRYYKLLYDVQVAKLQEALIQAKVISSVQDINRELNYPTIMAYYVDPADRSDYSKWSVSRINSFLTSQQFKVVDPGVMLSLNKDDKILAQSSGQVERRSQAIALKVNADLYMRIQIAPKIVDRSGDYTFVQSPVKVDAFESSSGVPFITKVYQRLDKSGKPEALAIKGNVDVTAKAVIEEAVAGVMPQVAEDLMRHWKGSVSKGKQYIVVVKNLGSKAGAFENALKKHCKDLVNQGNGQYVVRYQGVLGDLADQLEEELESIGLSIEKFDLGHAYFKIK